MKANVLFLIGLFVILTIQCQKDDNNEIENNLVDSIITGSFTDLRDFKVYKTVKIDDKWWLAENLKFSYGFGSRIYNNTEYTSKYGFPYNWGTACLSCPEGWHLPSNSEWEELAEFISNEKGPFTHRITALSEYWTDVGIYLKSETGWLDNGGGTDNYGFKALPGGYYWEVTEEYESIGYNCYFWSSTTTDISWGAYCRRIDNTFGDFSTSNLAKEDYYLSVRCVKD